MLKNKLHTEVMVVHRWSLAMSPRNTAAHTQQCLVILSGFTKKIIKNS